MFGSIPAQGAKRKKEKEKRKGFGFAPGHLQTGLKPPF